MLYYICNQEKITTLNLRSCYNMKINGKNIKGVKETVGRYNKIPLDKRTSFNIWYDNITNTVMLIENDIFEQHTASEIFTDELGFSYLRYDDVSDYINCEYPYLGNANISMAMLRSVLSQYIV